MATIKAYIEKEIKGIHKESKLTKVETLLKRVYDLNSIRSKILGYNKELDTILHKISCQQHKKTQTSIKSIKKSLDTFKENFDSFKEEQSKSLSELKMICEKISKKQGRLGTS